jgi:hypothetical protein
MTVKPPAPSVINGCGRALGASSENNNIKNN